jgi:hypothetical protein
MSAAEHWQAWPPGWTATATTTPPTRNAAPRTVTSKPTWPITPNGSQLAATIFDQNAQVLNEIYLARNAIGDFSAYPFSLPVIQSFEHCRVQLVDHTATLGAA